MMKPYIENEFGQKYELDKLTRKQKIEIVNCLKRNSTDDIEKVEELAYKLVKFNYPQLTQEEWENMLDYNEKTYGFNELYELLGALLTDVFTLQGGEIKEHPYLAMKKAQKQAQEIQTNPQSSVAIYE